MRAGGGRHRRIWILCLAGVAGLALAVLVYSLIDQRERNLVEALFDADVVERANAIEEEFGMDMEALHSLRWLHESSTDVTPTEFRTFCTSVFVRHADTIEGLSRTPAPADLETAPELPVEVGQTAPGAPALAGFDLAADPALRRAFLQARDQGSERGAVLGGGGPGAEPLRLLFVLPIYENDVDLSDTEARRRHLRHFVVALVNAENVRRHALGRFRAAHLEEPVLVPGKAPPGKGEASREGLEAEEPIQAADLTLLVRYVARPDYGARRRTASPLFLSGALLLVILLVAGLVLQLLRHTAQVEEQVEERTAEIARVLRLQQAILDSASYSIISTDPQGTILTFNAAAERMLGYRAEEMIGRCTPMAFHKLEEVEDRARELTAELGRPVEPGFRAFVEKAEQGSTDVHEWTYVRRDGSAFPVMLAVTALHDGEGRLTGFLGIGDDITERKESERRLREASAAAEEASRAKSQFLANMSHELRTPLNAVIGYSEMLEEDAVAEGNEKAAGDLNHIRSAGRLLLQLINEVLDLSKVEAGRVELSFEDVDVEALIREVVTTVRPLVAEKENLLEVEIADDVGSMVTDPTRLRQILFNLLSNAAKFTERGRIRLEATRDGNEVFLDVVDSGIGMTTEQLERVFEPFAQADESTTRRFGGTGLGLAICREYCRLLDGEISVRSEVGRGSRFRVRIPDAPERAAES